MESYNDNFQLALQFVTLTKQHLFLTGKAGTGKTTFLKYLREHCSKKMAVVAPTGVAAINAGGVTLHSLFQLPFGAFIPGAVSGWGMDYNGAFNNSHTLLKNICIGHEKRKLIYELELLIIDEISMVRADLLDAVDTVLRAFRKNSAAFGGVQLVFIGDMYQLPPVINNSEWEILNTHYASPFFFDAQVLKNNPPIYLELKKIYRQNDGVFIDLLNKIRNNIVTNADIQFLNKFYQPSFVPPANERYITLTTHNAKADVINQHNLKKLSGSSFVSEAVITGDFYDKSYPVEKTLLLKEGAQVIFIKNDKGEDRRFYNGKIATISKIADDKIIVRFPGEEEELLLEKEIWKNIRYNYNKESDEIEEDEIGSFTQYPIRLAWAITIHKSQGLTFEKAIIDAGASFAPGQVYVALSRLVSLAGLVLYSPINADAIRTDERIIAYSGAEKEPGFLTALLGHAQKQYITETLLQAFNFQKLVIDFTDHHDSYDQRKIPDKDDAIRWITAMLNTLSTHKEVADKFLLQLERLTVSEDNYALLNERIKAASTYFINAFKDTGDLLSSHIKEVKLKGKARKYQNDLRILQIVFERKRQQIKNAVHIAAALANGSPNAIAEIFPAKKQQGSAPEPSQTKDINARQQKGDSHRISLQLFKDGKTVSEIAQLRSLAYTTIEGHLATFVKTGELEISKLVPENAIPAIIKAIEKTGGTNTTAVREKLNNEYSHATIRAVMNYVEFKKQYAEQQKNLM